MILAELKGYLSERRVASLADIALHLEVSHEVARAMLARWVAKGAVECLTRKDACGACDHCLPGATELYRWIDDGSQGPEDPATTFCPTSR
ncbi:MAG: FeoC-like transcriptional regulator [Thiohalocapsa sp.]|jgi:hypothetical protein